MIEDFLARSGIGRCSEFRDTAEAVSKVKNTLASFDFSTENTYIYNH